MTAYLVIAFALVALGFLLLGRIPLCRPPKNATSPRPLSIIIPARNEENNLPRLLQSIFAQQRTQLEVIVVDDASTDATASLARELGATVISPPPLPPGWRGKTWACLHGAKAASNSTLLFLDADTWFEPAGLPAIDDRFARQPTVLSVLPYHAVIKPYESTSAFFQLVMAAGSGAFTFLPMQPAGLFGQMLMIDRDLYVRIGGHEAVKSEILENFHLAALLRRENIPLGCATGKRAISMRMYPGGIGDLMDGWTKAFAAGAARTPLALLLIIIAWLSGFVMTAAALIHYPGWYSLALYLFAVLQLAILLRRLGSFPLLAAIFFPLPLLAYFLLFARALTRRRVTWKGRVIDASA